MIGYGINIMSRFEDLILESIHQNEFKGGHAILSVYHPLHTNKHEQMDVEHEGEMLHKGTGVKFNSNRVGFRGEKVTLHHTELPGTNHHVVIVKHSDGSHSYGVHTEHGSFTGKQRSADSMATIHKNVSALHKAGEHHMGVNLS